jgi:septin family protein
MSVNQLSVNASFRHPFTCVVAGPSQSGKTTFVANLIASSHGLIDTTFKYILVYLGTSVEENPVFSALKESLPGLNIQVIDVGSLYQSKKAVAEKFPSDFLHTVKELGPGGCVIFDDLMQDLASANMITDLFSKYSAHLDLSVIHITQNIFYRGKQAQEHRTLYNNTHHLVLFPQVIDSTVFNIVARRISGAGGKKSRNISHMMQDVAEKHRYIIINGMLNRPSELKYTSDIFNLDPFPFQRVYSPLNSSES